MLAGRFVDPLHPAARREERSPRDPDERREGHRAHDGREQLERRVLARRHAGRVPARARRRDRPVRDGPRRRPGRRVTQSRSEADARRGGRRREPPRVGALARDGQTSRLRIWAERKSIAATVTMIMKMISPAAPYGSRLIDWKSSRPIPPPP